jgi:uncharacterized membrane protein
MTMQTIDLLVLIFVLFLGGAISIGVLCLVANAIAIMQDSAIQSLRQPHGETSLFQRLQMSATLLGKTIARHKSGQ